MQTFESHVFVAICDRLFLAFYFVSVQAFGSHNSALRPPPQRPVFQNTKRVQGKSLYLEILVNDHLS